MYCFKAEIEDFKISKIVKSNNEIISFEILLDGKIKSIKYCEKKARDSPNIEIIKPRINAINNLYFMIIR
jgi:hypothetical protein